MVIQKRQSLLAIVQSWNITTIPEYRGFRCGGCQRFINEAWHHRLMTGGYLTLVHLCERCEEELKTQTLSIEKKAAPEKNLKLTYAPEAVARFQEIIRTWDNEYTPVYKPFTCDDCGGVLDIDKTDGMRKGFHVWWTSDIGALVELHFHKQCALTWGI